MHAKREQHIAAAKERRAARQIALGQGHDITSRYMLRYVHVRRECAAGWGKPSHAPKGGCTVAYQLPLRKGGRIINVAVALVNDTDQYNKAQGRLCAALKFDQGERIQLRVPKNSRPSQFLKHMFSYMV